MKFKINTRNFKIIISAVVIIMMVLIFGMQQNFIIKEKTASTQRYEDIILTKIEDTINENTSREEQMIESLKEDYIIRAKAASYMIEHNPDLENNIDELIEIASLIKVDEIYMFDTDGMIYAGTIPEYNGYSFDSGEQMAYFKPMLDDYSLSMCQDVTPNTAEGRQMMYAIVWREDKTGMIQIGVEPTRLLAEIDSNDIYTTLDDFAPMYGVTAFIADPDTRIIVESTDHGYVGMSLDDIGYTEDIEARNGEDFFYDTILGESSYNTFHNTGEYIIGVSESRSFMIDDMQSGLIFTALYLLIIAIALILIIWKSIDIVYKVREDHIKEQDIQNRQLEEALKKAEMASEAKTTFLFNMSHDIRTPMNAIMGFTRLLKEHRNDEKQFDDYISKIESSNELLLSIINNVLDMARIESGKETLNEEPFDLLEINKEIIPVFAEQMKQKGINFIASSDFGHQYIYADGTKIKNICLNLLSNALKYTPSGGTVTITSREMPSDKPEYIIIEMIIEDTGIGMSKEFQKNIFEQFSRERSTTQSKTPGTGLGMAIVKRLIDMMGGTIEIESEPGKGTKVTVRNSHRLVDDQHINPDINDRNETDIKLLKGMRILLAEDNDLNAEIVITTLEDIGLSVDRASDGNECIEMLDKADSHYYDLILMDIQMPNMNGYEAARAIRLMKDDIKASIPIIAMTANAFEEDRKNAFEAGMNGHVVKPIDVNTLLIQISEVLNNS